MPTTPPQVNQFSGSAPQRKDKSTFSDRLDAFVTWIILCVTQLPALAANMYSNAVDAFNSALAASQSASTATSAAATAMATANASPWVSGTTYPLNACAISQVNFQSYRRAVAGAGTVDPANDATNWRILAGNNANGTFAPSPVDALEIDLSLGNYFTKTISSNSTFAFKNVPAGGSSFTLELTTTAAVAVALPSSVKTLGNATPPFGAGKTSLLMFSTSNGGARWRVVIAPNFDT
ncbi:hypothetical protein [Massilia sp. TN1-12]|uniref:hypothetical protein n=1 Tax=Massilia paldalensis TaxID=3377675 RepID=UPI00384A7BD5